MTPYTIGGEAQTYQNRSPGGGKKTTKCFTVLAQLKYGHAKRFAEGISSHKHLK
jgi:hypothetical protein